MYRMRDLTSRWHCEGVSSLSSFYIYEHLCAHAVCVTMHRYKESHNFHETFKATGCILEYKGTYYFDTCRCVFLKSDLSSLLLTCSYYRLHLRPKTVFILVLLALTNTLRCDRQHCGKMSQRNDVLSNY